MKTLIPSLLLPLMAAGAMAASTINAVNRYAYGANIGWTDWRADGVNGVVLSDSACTGYIYAANVGWIDMGQGVSGSFGVQHDGAGNLHGHAYGANIGWITFTNQDRAGNLFAGPRIDLITGRLSGFVYGANVGWISLSNATAFVQTDSLACPDTDNDGIADSYEMRWAGNLGTMDGTTDRDGDGVSDRDEFVADSNPTDPEDFLRITAFGTSLLGASSTISWTSRPTRVYRIHQRDDLNADTPWLDSALGLISPDAGTGTTRTLADVPSDTRFFRVQALNPLSP